MPVLKAKIDGQWVPVTAGGGASEEVFIGATDPGVNTTHELWFDSDAVSPADTARWNSAWGIISMGSFIPPYAPHAVTTTEVITNAVTATLITGRRYKVVLQIRAIVNTSGANTISFYLSDNGTQIRGTPYGGDPYVWSQGAYQGAHYEWQFTGDNTSHSFVVWVAPSASMSIFTDYGLWYIEDVGPISYGIPPAIDPTPTTVAWTPLALNSPWVGYSGAGRVPGLQYRKVGDMVHLRISVSGGAAGSSITTLPVGFRPPGTIDAIGRDGGGNYATLFNIQTDGTVLWYPPSGTAANALVLLNHQFSVTA